jgi:hypothetical protein
MSAFPRRKDNRRTTHARGARFNDKQNMPLICEEKKKKVFPKKDGTDG